LKSHASQVSILMNNTTISPCSARQLFQYELPGLGYSVFGVSGRRPILRVSCHCRFVTFSLQTLPPAASTFW